FRAPARGRGRGWARQYSCYAWGAIRTARLQSRARAFIGNSAAEACLGRIAGRRGTMRGRVIGLTGLLFSAASTAQTPAEQPRTAEQFIDTAREAYSVPEPEVERCATPVGNEIVVCRQLDKVPDQRLP